MRLPAECPGKHASLFSEIPEIPETRTMNLPPLIQAFVLHFGEMGGRWSINRTVRQIYALLFLSDHPLNADDLCATLGFSRSNTSIGLKELEGWRLVEMHHQPGDRREYFSTPGDVWQIVRTLVEERKKREIDPTLSVLRDLLLESPQTRAEQHAHKSMAAIYVQIELLTRWYADIEKLETVRLVQLLSPGSRVARIVDLKEKLFIVPSRTEKQARSEKDGKAS